MESSYGIRREDILNSSKSLCNCRGRCDGSWRPPCWRAGERSSRGTRQRAVAKPASVLLCSLPDLISRMAKKRAECGEGDGISTSENEIKAYATNSQALKGGFWVWWLNWTEHSILTERKIKNTRELITITKWCSYFSSKVTGWQNSNCQKDLF